VIPESFIMQLKSYSDIREVISSSIHLNRRGRNLTVTVYVSLGETPRPLPVYPDTQSFYCSRLRREGTCYLYPGAFEHLDVSRRSNSWRIRRALPCRRTRGRPGRARSIASGTQPRGGYAVSRTLMSRRERRYYSTDERGLSGKVHPPLRAGLRQCHGTTRSVG
jgi:hypothetical protein